MKSKGIIFSTDMVQALLDRRKKQTRRLVKPQPDEDCYYQIRPASNGVIYDYNQGDENPIIKYPYQPGQVLYVKETWWGNDDISYYHKASADEYRAKNWKWKSPLFMPRDAARIWLKVTDVKVERLQDISEEDAKAEGVFRMPHRCEASYPNDCYRCSFKVLWNLINGPKGYPWNSNPWVWAISFDILSTTGMPTNTAL